MGSSFSIRNVGNVSIILNICKVDNVLVYSFSVHGSCINMIGSKDHLSHVYIPARLELTLKYDSKLHVYR